MTKTTTNKDKNKNKRHCATLTTRRTYKYLLEDSHPNQRGNVSSLFNLTLIKSINESTNMNDNDNT